MARITPGDAGVLKSIALGAQSRALEFANFQETDPDLAVACGVEVGAVEARSILASGAIRRVVAASEEAERTGREAEVDAQDIDALSRLEGVLSLGASRINLKLSEMEAGEKDDRISRVGSMIGLASGAVGLVRSLFGRD